MSPPDGHGRSLSDLQDRLRRIKENLPYLEERLPSTIVQGYIQQLEKRIDYLLTDTKKEEHKEENEDKLGR